MTSISENVKLTAKSKKYRGFSLLFPEKAEAYEQADMKYGKEGKADRKNCLFFIKLFVKSLTILRFCLLLLKGKVRIIVDVKRLTNSAQSEMIETGGIPQ